MKCVLTTLCALMCVGLSEAKWCVKNITTEIEVAKTLSRTRLIPSWFNPQVKLETYQVLERVPVIKNKRVCCDGYTLDKSGQTCLPTCPNGCPRMSECVEPNTCKCHEGYKFNDGVCHLVCGNCENGRCTDLGSCECNLKYVRIDGTCKPICRQKCTNGFCAAPDKCECNPGYQENPEEIRCDPVCKENCGSNAYCSAPDVCTCKFGFYGNATEVCQPWCKAECKNGQCVGPNNCECHQGFVKVDGLCIPDCQSGCMFGDCLDEGICRCWPGFVYNNSTGSCQEGLELESVTSHKVYTIGSQTSTTETLINLSSPDSFCSNDCMNGTCRAGVCHCHEGFLRVESWCLINCGHCKIGHCVEKALCMKSPRMESQESVLSSTTTELFTTELFTTEFFTTEFSTSQFSSEDPFITIPPTESTRSCDNGCWAGTCVNGVCQCPDGLVLYDDNDCIMPCEATCKNGVCTQDGVCECRPGYVHKNGTECVPQCEKECVNSFCIAPNHCECFEGYIAPMSPLSTHICLPTCDGVDGAEGCLNGTCIAVNKCQCLEGFIHNPGNRFECIPFAGKQQNHRWYVYLLLGLLILVVMAILGLYALRKMQQDSYNVDKVEKCRGSVRYKNDEHPYCVI